ncbi:hypothetical protein O7626_26350 [Micromonospora sp. WMMD1102]|uniref:hypothetical protein n=1 Tax=Micromonospora sp. WMMD1102 TaxID=3016105 RepID=UPI002414D6D4|nr:hypothetical protein [Micromonospora sp. WMMD1102]MDG4789404.1 hypothetical protein [Micromonospora sp. WMMD1102]
MPAAEKPVRITDRGDPTGDATVAPEHGPGRGHEHGHEHEHGHGHGHGHGLSGLPDAGAFLARLTRFDPGAVVRLRSGAPGATAGAPARTVLWARLPWGVLVGRVVAGSGPGDATVSAAELLTELARGGVELPRRRDADWRWPVPGGPGSVVETIAGAELRRIAVAAADTLRDAASVGVAGRAVGQRAVRDALLDHVAVVVTGPPPAVDPKGTDPGSAAPAGLDPVRGGSRIEISQRLVQAIVRMGFLGSAGPAGRDAVQVRIMGRWVGLAAPFGVAWSQKVSQLAIKPARDHPNG